MCLHGLLLEVCLQYVLFLKFKYSENATKIVEDGKNFCDLLRISELYISEEKLMYILTSVYTSRTYHISKEKDTKKCKKDKSRQIFLKKSYVSLFIGYKLKSDEY